jgi:hypothetical protein
MKTKKHGPKIILGAFIAIICLLWFWWFLLGKYVDTSNYENRTLASKPRVTIDNWKTLSSEYDSWYNDNLPFRNCFVKLNSMIDYFVFDKSSTNSVVIGYDNWLFYGSVSDGTPIGDYLGDNLFSEEELEVIAQNCINTQQFLEQQGKEFVLFIVPNKERVYSDEMPRWYGNPSETYRALQVVEFLRDNTSVRVVYPYEEILNAKNILSEELYYKTDTHWNTIGAYVGTSALLKELGINMPDITSDDIIIEKTGESVGDLCKMLNLSGVLENDNEYIVTGYNEHDFESIEWDFSNMISYSAKGADLRKIYIYRDSYGSNMAAYIGSQFDFSYLRHKYTYTYDDFMEQNPDIFVYETVERYVGNLKNFSFY